MKEVIDALKVREQALIEAVRGARGRGRRLVWFQPLILSVPGGGEQQVQVKAPHAFEVVHVLGRCTAAAGLSAVELGYFDDGNEAMARTAFRSMEGEGSAVRFPLAAHQIVSSIAEIRAGQPQLWEGRRFAKDDKVVIVARDRSAAAQAYSLELTIIAHVTGACE